MTVWERKFDPRQPRKARGKRGGPDFTIDPTTGRLQKSEAYRRGRTRLQRGPLYSVDPETGRVSRNRGAAAVKRSTAAPSRR